MKYYLRLAVLLLATAGLALAGRPPSVFAATVTDSNCSSSTGEAALQTAITNAGSGGTVQFTCNGTITFTSTIVIQQSVILDAAGHQVTFDGQHKTQLFYITAAVGFGVNHLTLANGGAAYDGGAIYNSGGGTVTVNWSTFSGNTATLGGAIYSNGGQVTVNTTTFTGAGYTSNDGGAIYTYDDAVVMVTNSTFDSNIASGSGGAIYNDRGGQLTIVNSTFTGNSSGAGAAIFNDMSLLTIRNSTFTGNTATGSPGPAGGAIYNRVTESFTGTVTLRASILAGNTGAGAPECVGPVTSQGYNLIDNTTGCTITATTGDNFSANPSFQPLGNYGGPTQTMPLAPGSIGIDYIPLASCGVTIDQRDFPRGDGGETTCDAGAVETGSTSCVPPTFKVATKGSPPTATITVSDTNVGLDSVVVTASSNATITNPSFPPGTASTTVTVSRTNPNQAAGIALKATNTAGCVATLDPVMTEIVRAMNQPFSQVISNVAASETRVTVINGNPGLRALILRVNGQGFVLSGLHPGEERTLNIGSALHAGSNTVQLVGVGMPGGSATVLLGE